MAQLRNIRGYTRTYSLSQKCADHCVIDQGSNRALYHGTCRRPCATGWALTGEDWSDACIPGHWSAKLNERPAYRGLEEYKSTHRDLLALTTAMGTRNVATSTKIQIYNISMYIFEHESAFLAEHFRVTWLWISFNHTESHSGVTRNSTFARPSAGSVARLRLLSGNAMRTWCLWCRLSIMSLL